MNSLGITVRPDARPSVGFSLTRTRNVTSTLRSNWNSSNKLEQRRFGSSRLPKLSWHTLREQRIKGGSVEILLAARARLPRLTRVGRCVGASSWLDEEMQPEPAGIDRTVYGKPSGVL